LFNYSVLLNILCFTPSVKRKLQFFYTPIIMTTELQARVSEYGGLSIKERLLTRFIKSRNIVGKNLRGVLAKSDPFFNTKLGGDYLTSVAQAVSDSSRGNVDRIERVTIALEKVAGITPVPIV
jgi:hypothetical protein